MPSIPGVPATDRPKLTAQTRQFDQNPSRGESVTSVLAEPSEAMVAAEEWSQNRVNDPIVLDEDENRVRGYVAQDNPAPLLPRNRDAYRDAADSASLKDRSIEVDLPHPAHRDAYRDRMDSASIYHPSE